MPAPLWGRPRFANGYETSSSSFLRLFSTLLLCLLLFAQVLSGWSDMVAPVYAATTLHHPPSTPASLTLSQYLRQGRRDASYHGPLIRPRSSSLASGHPPYNSNPNTWLLSAEPATMQPIHQMLDATFLAGGIGAKPLDLVSSDHRLEVLIPPGALDLSSATLLSSSHSVHPTPAHGPFTLQLSQDFGHFAESISMLGQYEIGIIDAQGRPVGGMILHAPLIYSYHYQQWELDSLGLDPGKLWMSWPSLITAAAQAHQATLPFSLAMLNDSRTHTLRAKSRQTFSGVIPFDLGGGDPDNQSPTTPRLASTEGNSGQFAYSYPLQLPPGPHSLLPPLSLSYSSSDPNGRTSPRAPAGSVGDGWSLGIPSITAEIYPGSSRLDDKTATWYFLNNVEGVSDRLIQDTKTNLFQTEHLSRLRVIKDNGCATSTCFRVWDASGTYYEFGDSADSLQYHTDSDSEKHYYRWDLTRIIAPNEGPNGSYTAINFSYLQDCVPIPNPPNPCNGTGNVRDAVIKQIQYGYQATYTSPLTVVGTVDFSYLAPFNLSSGSITWATQYKYSDPNHNYACAHAPPQSTVLRCDDPIDYYQSDPAPTVMSTMSLQSLTSYVGSDTGGSAAYSYHFTYQDTPFYACKDINLHDQWCAGDHLLMSVTPTVYQQGTSHLLKPTVFGYTSSQQDSYHDSGHYFGNPPSNQQFGGQTYWSYLNSYLDTQSGQGANITYQQAFNNTNGTPYFYPIQGNTSVIEDRYDPFYCSLYSCGGVFNYPNQQAWSQQAVIRIAAWGTDSSATQLHPAVTTYAYQLAKTGTNCNAGTGPSPTPPDDKDCVGDNWLPPGSVDGDWQDYYHAEFRGFATVYITSPAGNLTVERYNSTAGWGSADTLAVNYNSGQQLEEDVYTGNQAVASALLSQTVTTYPGDNAACMSSTHLPSGAIYIPCESMVLTSKTTQWEGTTSGNPPWVQHAYTYDDFDGTTLSLGKYHNLTQEVITNANTSNDAQQITKNWSYNTTDQVDSGNSEWYYYDVDKVKQSSVTDNTGHIWGCQSFTYDENAPTGVPTPAAGWLTTSTSSSDCTKQSSTAITTYTSYDAYGNPVAAVDGVAAANPSLYSSNGCQVATPPAIYSLNWTAGRYTACTTYDPTYSQPIQTTNAFGQTNSINYDPAQGNLPTSTTDSNTQTTSTSFMYDANSGTNGKVTIGVKLPQESGSSTTQSYSTSYCPNTLPSSSTTLLPCLEADSTTTTYANAVSRTYYDSLGRAVETQTPVPTPIGGNSSKAYVRVTFTVYNEAQNSVFTSLAFTIVSQQNNGSWWVDPNGIQDYQSQPVGGTATYYDALGRVIAIKDPLFNANQSSGIPCPSLGSNASACSIYGLGSALGDANTYADVLSLDPNNHANASFTDALGRTLYAQAYSGTGVPATLSTNVIQQKSILYNILNEPISVMATDEAPLPNESTTSVTSTAKYDDLGRLTKLTDPDRGIETYSYDAAGRVVAVVSSPLNSPHSRTLGSVYDLLGRLGCVQDAAAPTATPNATGACTTGNPYVQNTYDTTTLTLSGTTDYPTERLTQSVTTTYFPDSTTPGATSATTTDSYEHDARGQLIGTRLQFGLPSSWNVTNPLPTYQLAVSYNDVGQAASSTTSTIPSGWGYTQTPIYDPTTGVQTGIGAGSTPLASAIANTSGTLDTLNLLSSSGATLITQQFGYDGNLRPTGETACWVSIGCGGTNGTILSLNRTFDAASNVTSVSTTLTAIPGVQTGGSEVQDFCYNEQNQLVWAGTTGTIPGAGNGTCGSTAFNSGLTGANYEKSYQYTHLGQLWQSSDLLAGTQSQYLYCDSVHPHQLTGIYGSGATCTNQGTAQYSATYKDSSNNNWGNVYQRTVGSNPTATLNMDHFNHLTFWDTGSPSTGQEWTIYDAGGNRVLLRSSSGTSTTMTVYAFGLEEHSYSKAGANQSNLYYYALGGQLIGALKQNSGGGGATHFFLADALGSVTVNINRDTSTVEGEQLYDPYGNVRYSPGNSGTNLGFTGQYSDSLSGLDYYNARYYDPVAGVFISADVVQGNLVGMNPYAYVGGNPETYSDPTGQMFGWLGNWFGGLFGWGGGHHGGGRRYRVHRCGVRCQYGGNDNWLGVVGFDIRNWVANPFRTMRRYFVSASKMSPVFAVYRDVVTLRRPHGSFGAKLFAGIDLGLNVVLTAFDLGEFGGEAEAALHEGEAVAHEGEASWHEGEAALHGGSCSFTFATAVTTAHGKQAIGTLHVGEKVLAYNPTTHKMETEPILHVCIHTDNDLVDLTIATPIKATHSTNVVLQHEVVHTNQKHPFFTLEKGFVPVGQITKGMHVLRADGRIGVITGWQIVPGVKLMYNLEVAQDHTFVVGDGQWIVHNCGARPFDIVSYEPRNSPFENHHGILDVWARNNIAGYDSAKAPTVVLTLEQHNATRSVFASWRYELTGSVTGAINWKNVSASDIFSLSEIMFDAAGVPGDSRQAYYRAFHEFLYTGSFTPFAYR